MAIIQISKIQNRRGLLENIPPALGSGELGWALDERRLFIGNGVIEEGAPQLGNTEILTEHSNVLELSGLYTYRGERAGYTVQTGANFLSPHPRSVTDKFDDNACIRDFGGVGDGSATPATDGDLQSINRAITQLYKSTLYTTTARIRRTLFFPAGVYVLNGTSASDVINLKPYVKLKGEGKNSTFIIQINPSAPCVIRTVDSNGNTDVNIGANGSVNPGFNEIEGITLINVTAADIFQLDSANDIYCSRVRFQHSSWSPDVNYVPLVTDAIARVNESTPSIPELNMESCVRVLQNTVLDTLNLIFEECDFVGQNYAFYSDKPIANILMKSCEFLKLYGGVYLTDPNMTATNVKVISSTFDEISASAISTPNTSKVTNIVSAFNQFGNVGYRQVPPTSTVPATPYASPVNFRSDNCYSFGDTFAYDYTFETPAVNLNDNASFATLPSGQLRLGTQQYHGGRDIMLYDGETETVAGVVGYQEFPTKLEYTLYRGLERRIGTMQIVALAGNVSYSDDYVETGETGVTLAPQLNTTGTEIELLYSTTVTGNKGILKVASRTLAGLPALPVIAATVPDAPTNVTVTDLYI